MLPVKLDPPVFILHTATENWTHGQNGMRTDGMGIERGIGNERERSWE